MIPTHVKQYLRIRGVRVVGMEEGEERTEKPAPRVVEQAKAEEPQEATTTIEVPNFASMKYADLRKLLPNGVEKTLPDARKATLVKALEQLFLEGKLEWPS